MASFNHQTVKLVACSLLLLVYQTSAQHAMQHRQDGNSREYSNSSVYESWNNYQHIMRKPVLNEVLPSVTGSLCSSDDCCPPWFYYDGDDCQCGKIHHKIIKCNNTLKKSAVLDCFCVTYDEETNSTVAGACYYNCENVDKKNYGSDVVYHKLPGNLSELNKFMCQHHWLNRTGPLCGRCMKDMYPLAYSYNMSCVTCPDGHKNWWKYILAAFFPLTVFYFVVLFFKINANTSHLHGYIFFSQFFSVPAFPRIIMPSLINTPTQLKTVKVIVSLYGIWTLDFFRALLPQICLRTTTLQTLALDYAIAVYPLLLMIVSYTLIELHDRNFKVVVFIWKPFRCVLTFFRRNWDSRTSVIDSYATFFLLSSEKFLSTSFDLLTPARLYKLNSNESSLLVLYYDGSIEYFSPRHLPFAVLAIVVLFLFVFLPTTVLFLYPFKLFQKFLGLFPTRWYNILHTFVDSFLGCYKDGTEPGTRDCRWFAILFLLWRILAFLIYSITVNSDYFPSAILLLLLLAILLVTVQPFKPEVAHYTKINVTFVLLLASFYASIVGMDISSIKAAKFNKTHVAFAGLFTVIPLVYISVIVIHWLFAQRKWGKNLILKIKAWRQGYDWMTFENDQDDFEDSLPDRIVNPNQYHEGNLSNFHNVISESGIQELPSNTY